MKRKISHAIVLDNPLCILSLLWRIVKASVSAPCTQYYVFVCCANGLHTSRLTSLMSVASLSTVNGSERASFSFLDLRLPDIQRVICRNGFAFSRINVILFASVDDIFSCFTVRELELFFLCPNEEMLLELLSHNCTVTPSIAMTPKTSDLFFQNDIPFKMAEYFREILFIRGRPDAKIHVKRSVIGQEQLTPSYNQQVIDGILQQFFFNEESFEEDEDPELNDEGRDSGSIVEDSSDEEQPET